MRHGTTPVHDRPVCSVKGEVKEIFLLGYFAGSFSVFFFSLLTSSA